MKPVIITAAVTGGEHGREATPHLPITPLEIATAAHEAHLAGAAIVHIHVRDDESLPCADIERYAFVLNYLHERCDVIVNVTTDPGGTVPHDQRMVGLDLEPELATFDAGTMSWDNRVMLGSESFLRVLGNRMKKTRTKPEIEIFHDGMIGTSLKLADEGILKSPLYFQFVLGVPGGAPATVTELAHLLQMIPPDSPWGATGIGRHSVPIAFATLAMDGHVRVGLEDQIYYSPGRLATSSAQLVERVTRLAEEVGREIATPEQAREILGLKGSAQVQYPRFVKG